MGRSRGRQLITGLDVGTTKISCVIAEWSSIGTLDIVGVGISPSRGLRKGVVVNIDSTVESIKQAVGDAEEMAGVEISSVIAGVAGGHIRGANSRGVVAVSGKHREVSAADVERALDAARAINLPQDREIIHALPQTYLVDDQDGVKEPLGMSGVRLEVEVHLVTGATTSVRNVVRSVNRAGLQVQDIVLEPLASAEAVLSEEEKELGILLIDLGGGTTDVALFRDDEVISVPSVGGRKARELSRQICSEIIQPRVEEIFTLVARELAKAGLEDAAAAGVVVTGGTAIMQGVPELAEQIFDLPVRRGVPTGIGGLHDVVQSPIHATGVGLALYGARGRRASGTEEAAGATSGSGMRRRLRDWFGELF